MTTETTTHRCVFGQKWHTAHFTGNPYRRCVLPNCSIITMDSPEDESLSITVTLSESEAWTLDRLLTETKVEWDRKNFGPHDTDRENWSHMLSTLHWAYSTARE